MPALVRAALRFDAGEAYDGLRDAAVNYGRALDAALAAELAGEG